MNLKKPTKSRTANTGLKKKVHLPIWAVIVGILVVAGIGIAFVYNSYATSSIGPERTRTIYCNRGVCKLYSFGGSRPESRRVRYTTITCGSNGGYDLKYQYYVGSKGRWLCLRD